MKRMNDPEGFGVKVLMGCSWMIWLLTGSNGVKAPLKRSQAAFRSGWHS